MNDGVVNDGVVRLSFPAKPDYLLLARLALGALGRTLPLDEELVADLKLAVTEASGNAVRHAYDGGAGRVGVSFVLSPDRLEMVVEDQGMGMGMGMGLDAAGPGEAGRETADSGMGFAIIRAIVDELEVAPGADGLGTVVRMTKHFGHTAGEPGERG